MADKPDDNTTGLPPTGPPQTPESSSSRNQTGLPPTGPSPAAGSSSWRNQTGRPPTAPSPPTGPSNWRDQTGRPPTGPSPAAGSSNWRNQSGPPPPGPPRTGPPRTGTPPAPGPSRSRDQTDGIEAPLSQPPYEMTLNKYWPNINSYHGPWLHIPIEELEVLAKSNWALPRPRIIDPAVFFDLLKIRQLTDEACDLAVRATAGIATSALSKPFTIARSMRGSRVEALGLGSFGPGVEAQLSPERKFRMREKATQKLSEAYRLDDTASCIVTMRGPSVLGMVAKQVVETPREDLDCLDGKYVHYFHEKTDDKAMMKPEAFSLLDEVINERHLPAEPLRTRAVAKMLQENNLEAVEDLTKALQFCRSQKSLHKPKLPKSQNNSSSAADTSGSSKCKEKKLDENDYPSSLEAQVLFRRASAYLDLASQTVEKALPSTDQSQRSSMGASNESNTGGPSVGAEPEAMEREKQGKLVKEYAKRALRDYTSYLSLLDYTPDLDPKHMDAFDRRVFQTAVGFKLPKGNTGSSSNPLSGIPSPVAYQMSTLFSATPPSLQPNPQTDILVDHDSAPKNASDTSALHAAAQQLLDSANKNESLTYHPLLVDVLHSLLLCHVLVQTSDREIHRHAHMAARLIRSCDGYPIFEPPLEVQSRKDWLEVLSRVGERFDLGESWDFLCRPRLYRRGGVPPVYREEGGGMKETRDEKRERLHRKAVLETVTDKSITDDETFKKELAAKKTRQVEEERKSTGKSDEDKAGPSKGKAKDEDHNVGSNRARSIVRWVLEAPQITNPESRKKKKRKTKGRGSTRGRGYSTGRGSLNSSMGNMSITDDQTVETPNEGAD
ncbi:hypothetical protein VE04_04116 [Pseudogymnoascus sp. 24MN13]|nr:hypothetical protein VE04_04116 [Pseudogymnoascus sp. 24MN13]